MSVNCVVLKKGSAQAVIKTLGGELISYVDNNGREVLFDGDPAYWRGQSPVLFPVIGFCKNGEIKINGKTYPMEKHGFARHQVFTAQSQTEDRVEMVLRENESTLKLYPFAFELKIIYQLLDNGISVTYTVENHSESDMPFLLGGHPALNCPMEEDAQFEDYALIFETPENAEQVLVNQDALIAKATIFKPLEGNTIWPLDRQLLKQIDTLMLTNLKSKSVKLVNQKTGKGILFSFDTFPVLSIWTTPNALGNYVCIEPWQGLPSWFNEDCDLRERPYAITLKPGQKHQAMFAVSILA